MIIGVAAELRLQTGSGATQEAELCLSGVAPLPKSEGYSTLCTSIANLYQQQRTAASSFVALQEEGERTHTSMEALERHNGELQARIEEGEQSHQGRVVALEQYYTKREKEWHARVAELEQSQIKHRKEWHTRIVELEQSQIKREKQWHAAAEKLQAGVAARDGQWQTTVARLEGAEEKKLEKGLAKRDAHWQASIWRIEQQALKSQQQQKEAMEASTSVGTQSRRAILLALTREKQRSSHENKEVRGLLEQIKALQRENAQLVQQCVSK